MPDASGVPIDLLWGLAGKAGFAGIVAIFWWLERQERKEAQKRIDVLVDRLTDRAAEIKEFKDLLISGRRGPQ